MKTILIACLCIIASITSKAQLIINNTPCDVKVTPFCYNNATCAPTPCAAVLVPANSSVALPNCGCVPPSPKQGYAVCWVSCPTICAAIGNITGPWPCPQLQQTGTLQSCPGCLSATVKIAYSTAGDLLIN